MEVKSVKDCFEARLLRKIAPDKEKSRRSLEISKQRLEQAKKAIELGVFAFAVIEAYTAMFHAARALLYRDGIQEKSHFAIYVYLKEKYSSKIALPVLNSFNIHRIERHETLYGFDYKPDREDAAVALEDSKEFVKEIERCVP